MNVGIIGLGVVGNAIKAYNEKRGNTVYGYDIKSEFHEKELEKLNENCELVFICTPTPCRTDGLLDTSSVFNAISKLKGTKAVVIKSTMNPGTTDSLAKLYPQFDIGYCPEFLSECTALDDVINPPRPEIFGWSGDKYKDSVNNTKGLENYYHLKAEQAELLKLATNAFYAMKVIFANILYDAGMEQGTLDVLATDPRIGAKGVTHFTVNHKGYRGYGGACLPKDTEALKYYLKNKNVDTSLIDAIISYNEQLLSRSNNNE